MSAVEAGATVFTAGFDVPDEQVLRHEDRMDHRPPLRAVLRRVWLTLLVACVAPACLFYTCFRITDLWTAMFTALAWSYGAIAWRAMTGRGTSGLLLLTSAVMTGRTAIAVLTDSSYLYFLQPIINDGLIAAVFLVSLSTARPMAARLAADFYPLDPELSLRPRMRHLFRGLTLMWGALGLAKAATMLWLLHTRSLENYVLIKSISAPTINALAVATTIAAAAIVARKEGLLGPASRAPGVDNVSNCVGTPR
jgi:intracellular septation protein A